MKIKSLVAIVGLFCALSPAGFSQSVETNPAPVFVTITNMADIYTTNKTVFDDDTLRNRLDAQGGYLMVNGVIKIDGKYYYESDLDKPMIPTKRTTVFIVNKIHRVQWFWNIRQSREEFSHVTNWTVITPIICRTNLEKPNQ